MSILHRPAGLLLLLISCLLQSTAMAEASLFVIDDRSNDDLTAATGNSWQLLTDNVMGGVSRGQLTIDSVKGHKCLRMQGDVRLENDGGFVQLALNLSPQTRQNISAYKGIMIEVYGNNQSYNIHLRSDDIQRPWQSYRVTFRASSKWQTLYFPFAEFKPYRIDIPLEITKLKRIGLVAIGRAFAADLCLAKLALYR